MTGRGPTPRSVGAVAAVAALLVLVPLAALLIRAPWADALDVLTAPGARTALRLSLVTSLWAAGLSVLLGTPLAWVLARADFPGRRALRALVLVPLVLPPVVGGVALLLAFGRRGVVGKWLYDGFGVQLPFSTAGAVLAATFVAMPFMVITAESAFRGVDQRLEEAARTAGAGRWLVLRRVVLPLAAPGLGAGALLAWARALGEFGATITFAGSSPGRTTTVPLQVYLDLEAGRLDGAVTLSLLLLAVSVTILVGLRDRWLGRG